MSSLVPVGDGPPAVRCALCGRRDAAGPCARCRKSICGDCCELSTGGVTTFAVCLSCIRRGGASLRSAWLGLLGWLGLVILAFGAVIAVLFLLGR